MLDYLRIMFNARLARAEERGASAVSTACSSPASPR
jgi:hypothetical protein